MRRVLSSRDSKRRKNGSVQLIQARNRPLRHDGAIAVLAAVIGRQHLLVLKHQCREREHPRPAASFPSRSGHRAEVQNGIFVAVLCAKAYARVGAKAYARVWGVGAGRDGGYSLEIKQTSMRAHNTRYLASLGVHTSKPRVQQEGKKHVLTSV